MTDEELMVLRDKVDGAVRAAMEKELTAKRMELVHRELDAVLREITRSVIAGRRDEIRAKVEAWLSANTEAYIERTAKQMLDEALGEVKRRVLGRS